MGRFRSSRKAYASGPPALRHAGFRLRGQPSKSSRVRARLREMRFVNVTGSARTDSRLEFWGSQVRCVPLSQWHEQFLQQKVKVNAEVKAIADYYLQTAQRISGQPFPNAF